jgi:hypothetical protein
MVNVSTKTRRSATNSTDDEQSEKEYQVEAVINKRVRGKKTQYLLKWKGYSDAENSVRYFLYMTYKLTFVFLETKSYD